MTVDPNNLIQPKCTQFPFFENLKSAIDFAKKYIKFYIQCLKLGARNNILP